jgi:lysophospholipase L1-like esterase
VNRIGAASAVLALAAAGIAAGCTEPGTSASEDAPLPTIGLDGGLADIATIPSDVVADDADDLDSIVMIGDSITVASTPALEEQFAGLGFDDSAIEAVVGKRIAVSTGGNPSGVDVADFIVGADDGDSDGELWIVALGTNDVNQYGSPDEIAAVVNEMLDAVPDDVPLVWVETYYRSESDGAALINAIVTDRLARRGNSVVAPWNAFASGDGIVQSDGVHPTDAGTIVFADVVAATITDFLGLES